MSCKFLIAFLAIPFLATPAAAFRYLDQTSPSKSIGIGQIGRGGVTTESPRPTDRLHKGVTKPHKGRNGAIDWGDGNNPLRNKH